MVFEVLSGNGIWITSVSCGEKSNCVHLSFLRLPALLSSSACQDFSELLPFSIGFASHHSRQWGSLLHMRLCSTCIPALRTITFTLIKAAFKHMLMDIFTPLAGIEHPLSHALQILPRLFAIAKLYTPP